VRTFIQFVTIVIQSITQLTSLHASYRAVFVFDLHINFINFLGIALTIAGGAFYSYVEYSGKNKMATSPTVTNGLGAAVDEKIRLSNRGRIV
jgi:hypothetical protein